MKIIAAYLLAVLGGNTNPNADAINKILSSVGIEADSAAVNKLISDLQGKDINEVIAQGSSKLASLPVGGAAPASSAAPAASSAAAPAKEEKKKEEEKKAESDEDMGFGLFD
mmetsp:Transcript_12179/g.16825  ORF Transcript_12179/g.16825 Transcript_12179/m.16825 type:complete len:112 (-) Transcript_12179:73-408(-)|eukprot:CAMPEP_0168557548 /NCGR_PEP_ID=MMETSP0413-20121227/9486_1 /TAXON_ID=136452 /ORGANISM="Filamoeba nolandi, Strain NC-AS-23-1" /LENGTH=111 /DNA_ID=CAMNT_0008588591 /DNA_START=109 /DNA_END=444 /DNA_ORIENTATION=-